MENAKKQVFALIGGIASGKSVASEIFAARGAYIIDADVISHSVTAPGSKGEAALMRRFPSCVVGGELSRRLVRREVFGDERALKDLNAITHPLILREMDRMIASASGTAIVVMPLPMWLKRFDAVLGIYTPVQKRIERLIRRDNIDEELARRIMAVQMSDEEIEKVSDFTFVNDGDEADLERKLGKWWDIFVEN